MRKIIIGLALLSTLSLAEASKEYVGTFVGVGTRGKSWTATTMIYRDVNGLLISTDDKVYAPTYLEVGMSVYKITDDSADWGEKEVYEIVEAKTKETNNEKED